MGGFAIERDDPAYRGQSDYTGALLRLYDPLVLGPIARHVWRCPAGRLLEQYRRHARCRHLDVGPGTGYFLANAGLAPDCRVTIVDPNTNVLAYTTRRLQPRGMTAVEADVLKPLPIEGPFDSAAMNLVLHCLPGPPARKDVAVANVAQVLAPDGVLFGATVLGMGPRQTRLSRAVLRAFNGRGAFDNLSDTEEAVGAILGRSFDNVEIDVTGSVALFAATSPRRIRA